MYVPGSMYEQYCCTSSTVYRSLLASPTPGELEWRVLLLCRWSARDVVKASEAKGTAICFVPGIYIRIICTVCPAAAAAVS